MGKTVSHPVYVLNQLSEPAILGIDFMHKHGLSYHAPTHSFQWTANAPWQIGTLQATQAEKFEPLSTKLVAVNLITENSTKPQKGQLCVASLAVDKQPWFTGGPALITSSTTGQAYVEVINTSPVERVIPRNESMGIIENIDLEQIKPLNNEQQLRIDKIETIVLNAEKRKFLVENANLQDLPENERKLYLDLILKHHSIFSTDKNDLGRCNLLQHEILLKSKEPVYVKQFRIPDAHREAIEKQVAEWLKLGIVQPTRSRYNSPIFVVTKKDGGIRLVQDFRALNAQTYIDKYSMRDVQDCIDEIGRAGSTVFSTIDLTSGFWQMLLHPKSRPLTAFTVTGMGQFEFVTSPMGLLGCPASFQRLMEAVTEGLRNIIVYIDDLFVHSHTHSEHRQQLEDLFTRLAQHNLKINLKKCFFGQKKVEYLGFSLTENGILPGTEKLKAVSKAAPPDTIQGIRQFLGLCNFFRNHIKDFAILSHPLVALTKKETKWSGGPLPEEALRSFNELKTQLCSNPIIDFPRKNRQYALITDAALGDDVNPGGLGAILTQIDNKGQFRVLAYASRKLQKHEKNYTPFLLEMQAAYWGMEHFMAYLKGNHFILYTDHKPLEKLGKVHTKTLYRIQEAMLYYNFEIVYKKGTEMPADFLSRNVISSISPQISEDEMRLAQKHDPLISKIVDFLALGILTNDPKTNEEIRFYALDCFLQNDILWRRLGRHNLSPRSVMFLPRTMAQEIVSQFHGQWDTGHEGISKTKERILLHYYWPGMDKDIATFIQQCHKCQMRKKIYQPQAPLQPLPLLSEPNMRIHVDLFGPLKTTDSGKKYILCMTDAFTKYVELVPLPNKETQTVVSAIFFRWICRYGVPLEIISDQGKEFVSNFAKELYNKLGLTHNTTSPHHPQCNAQAEVANKTIAKYLSDFVNDTTLDWELYIYPLMFAYNTSFHRTIKNSPFFLTFGVHPKLPKTYLTEQLNMGESPVDDLTNNLQLARQIAMKHNEKASIDSEDYYNQNVNEITFQIGQLVLLNETSFLNRNAKLSPKFTGPHRILQFKSPVNVEILLAHSNRKLIVHVNRLKPYVLSQDIISPPPSQTLHANNENLQPDIQFQNRGGVEREQINEDLLRQPVMQQVAPPPAPPPVQRQLSHAPPQAAQVEKPLTRSATRAQNLVFDKQKMTFGPPPAPVIAYIRKKLKKNFGYIYPSDELYSSLSESYPAEIHQEERAPSESEDEDENWFDWDDFQEAHESEEDQDQPEAEQEPEQEPVQEPDQEPQGAAGGHQDDELRDFPPEGEGEEDKETPQGNKRDRRPPARFGEYHYYVPNPPPLPKKLTKAPPFKRVRPIDRVLLRNSPLRKKLEFIAREADKAAFGKRPTTRTQGPVPEEKLPDKPLEYSKAKKK